MMFTVTGTFSPSSSTSSIPPSTAKCRAQKFETIDDDNDDIIDGTRKELNNSETSNSTTVQSIDKGTTLTTTQTLTNKNLNGNIDGNGKSVHGIVASLIRAAEETRFQAPDKPKSLNFNNKKIEQKQSSTAAIITINSEQQQQQQQQQQETGTQTSPYSLSRSSSFDWINESSIDDQYSEELMITSTESPGTSEDPQYSSLNQTVESHTTDKKVQGMLQHDGLNEKRKIQSSENIDDSIAMLLEYAEDLDIIPNRELHYPITNENFIKVANDMRDSETILTREISSDNSRNRISSTNNQNEFFRRFTSSTDNANSTVSLTGSKTSQYGYIGKGCSQGSMNGSIYDNVPHGIKHPSFLVDSTSVSSKLNHDAILSHSAKVMDNSSSPNDSAISQRDISVSSGLADSESSPITPGAPTSIRLHHNRYRKQQSNTDNRSQITQIKIDSSFNDTNRNGKEIRSPLPSSPRLDTEKRTLSMVLASDLFTFSTGHVPERVESCEELDVDFTEQVFVDENTFK
ncbi:unnamed protein product [Acanthocheilonema viteae]|uniref:Uncharacterized protein n=1 Tax=Acanthocheilonema viteae TaxID=6277 RepID=A0A498SKL2_ACAVI|nr:unnamed protein product [Acanthocheilonema viteae]